MNCSGVTLILDVSHTAMNHINECIAAEHIAKVSIRGQVEGGGKLIRRCEYGDELDRLSL